MLACPVRAFHLGFEQWFLFSLSATDVNDQAPIFNRAYYAASVPTSTPVDAAVLHVRAQRLVSSHSVKIFPIVIAD